MSIQARMKSYTVQEHVDQQSTRSGAVKKVWTDTGTIVGSFIPASLSDSGQVVNYSNHQAALLTLTHGTIAKVKHRILIDGLAFDVTDVDSAGRYEKITLKAVEEHGKHESSSE